MVELRLSEVGPTLSQAAREALDLRGGDTARVSSPIITPTVILNRKEDPIPIQFPRAGRNQTPFWLLWEVAGAVTDDVSNPDNVSTGSPITTNGFVVPANKSLRILDIIFTSSGASDSFNLYDGAPGSGNRVLILLAQSAWSARDFNPSQPLFFPAGTTINFCHSIAATKTAYTTITGILEDA